MKFALVSILLIFTELLYFVIARKNKIFDVPNHRSSHQISTLRGGGIIFIVAAIIFFAESFQYRYFFTGLILLSSISLLDDLYNIKSIYRFIIQILAVSLLLIQFKIPFGFNFMITTVFGTAILNAFNFMDGINGITGLYSLSLMFFLLLINTFTFHFIENDFILYIIISVIVFLFFNFRKTAITFCGDVGSVGIGYITLFLLFNLIFLTQNWKFLFFLSLYGIDTIYTIFYRLNNKENILNAHREHFFQILVHRYNLDHLVVSTGYFFVQVLINLFILTFEMNQIIFYSPFLLIIFFIHYFRQKKQVAINLKLL